MGTAEEDQSGDGQWKGPREEPRKDGAGIGALWRPRDDGPGVRGSDRRALVGVKAAFKGRF